MMGRLDNPATGDFKEQYSFRVDCTSQLLFIPFRLEADYVFLQTSHFFSSSSSYLCPQLQVMSTQTPEQGPGLSELSRMTGTSSNVLYTDIQQEWSHQLVLHGARNEATNHVTHNCEFIVVSKTGSRNKKKHHATGCV